MKIIDISVPIKNNMVVWPGDPSVNNQKVNDIEAGDDANVTTICMSAHTGTHIDAPNHFVQGGQRIENLDLNVLIGEVEVIEIGPSIELINAKVLEDLIKEKWPIRVLFRTRNSERNLLGQDHFSEDFVAVSKDAANYLVKRGVKLVGIDYLSIAPFEDSVNPHVSLLKNEIVILEGLDLSHVKAGVYHLIALPLKLEGSDGAPARVILIQN